MIKMKNFQLSGVMKDMTKVKSFYPSTVSMKVLIGILFVCFLLGTTYIASRLSSLPTKTFLQTKHHHPLWGEFIQVLIQTEKYSLIGAVTLANSIISNTNSPVHFYFITDLESSKELHFWLENSRMRSISYEIKVVSPTDSMFSYKVENESWLKTYLIHIPTLFPQADRRLIVLSDDIIVQGDIKKLNDVMIAENHFGALSTDCDTVSKLFDQNQNKYVHYFDMKNPAIKDMDINGTKCIFNMGVMVLNMTSWKQKNVTRQLLHWIELDKKENIFHIRNSLSPFLLVFYNQISPLTNSWHVRHLGSTTGSRYSRGFLEKAELLHWDGHFKPWKHKSPFTDLWKRYSISRPTLKIKI